MLRRVSGDIDSFNLFTQVPVSFQNSDFHAELDDIYHKCKTDKTPNSS